MCSYNFKLQYNNDILLAHKGVKVINEEKEKCRTKNKFCGPSRFKLYK